MLYFGNALVGTIVQTGADFPGMFGTYQIDLANDQIPLHQHIHNYIQYSAEASRLMMFDGSDGGEWDRYQSEHELKYIDLIESDCWRLMSGEVTTHILIPNFGTNNEVNWRLA